MNRTHEAQLGMPDRVPVYGQIHEFAMARSGISAREFYTNGRLLVESIIETAREFDLDDPHIDYDTYTIEAEAMGMEVDYYDDQAPQLNPTEPLVREKSDLTNLKPPVFGESGRMPFVLDVARGFQVYLCSVDATTPPENLTATVAAVREHGSLVRCGRRKRRVTHPAGRATWRIVSNV